MKLKHKLPLCVGLTGGMGSGKSTAAVIFKYFGIPVYIADEVAKKLIDTNEEIRKSIIRHFGKKSYTEKGLNRKYISDCVFTDSEKLSLLNSITHPPVKRHFLSWLSAQTAPYAIKEAAILFEAGSYRDCDLIVNILAPEELRVQRVIKRSGLSAQEVESRIAQQWPDYKRAYHSDYNVLNDGKHSLINQIAHIHEDIIRRANQRS
ncbi:MAG: dephospho-CoA kinase [Thermaurantimonas sp.]